MPDFHRLRREMVEAQLIFRGITDPGVLCAMEKVPREFFVPHHLQNVAYGDHPLAIGEGQTISQPFIVAYMLQAAALSQKDRLLEVGTGSGYGAAVASCIVDKMYTVELLPELALAARQRLQRLDCRNVTVVHGDGSLGLPDKAPFDAIVVTAAAPSVSDTLLSQLAHDGRLVIPVGERASQKLVLIKRVGDQYHKKSLDAVRFVPLRGKEGWAS